MPTLEHYPYPHAEAEFNLYNFHSQQQVDDLADVLASKDTNSPRAIQLFGERGSGRHYLLRAAAYYAMHRGTAVAVEELSLDGYEPDTPLRKMLQYLSQNVKSTASDKLSEQGRQTKLEVKVTPANLIFASVGVKADLSVEDILGFFEATSQTPGPGMSDRERLRLFLDRVTKRQRLALYIRDSQTLDIALRLRLIDEADLNPEFFVAFGYLSEDSGTTNLGRASLQVRVPAWTREEMQRAFAERFQPNKVAEDFFDFAWSSGTTTHSREAFARVVLRLVKNNWLFTDRNDSWSTDPNWQSNELLVQEFSRDLFEPVLRIKGRVETLALPKDQIGKVFDFLDSAALCDPTIPVYPLLEMIGVLEGERDDFIEWLDDLFDVGNADGILEDLGFQHPGFPPAQLIYRFRNPVLARAVLKRRSHLCDLAIQVFNFMHGIFRLDTRAVANLYMRLADVADLGNEAAQFEKALSYWTTVEETEALTKAIAEDLRVGDVSPQVVWSIVALSKNSWPPARRLALLEAYGTQSDGIPLANRFYYFATTADILLELGRIGEAIDAMGEAMSSLYCE